MYTILNIKSHNPACSIAYIGSTCVAGAFYLNFFLSSHNFTTLHTLQLSIICTILLKAEGEIFLAFILCKGEEIGASS